MDKQQKKKPDWLYLIFEMENIPDSMCLNVAVKLCIEIIYDTKMQSKKERMNYNQTTQIQTTNERMEERV